MESDHSTAALYCGVLEDIQARLDVVRAIAAGRLNAGCELHNYEIGALNLRKALEAIAFGSLCANKEVYANAYADFATHWRAKRLLDSLQGMHPDFFPKPVLLKVLDPRLPRKLHFDLVTDGFLTREEFVELYDVCSTVIHARNPFSPRTAVDFRMTVLDWAARIEGLLKMHLMRLAGTREIWICELRGSDGRAHAYVSSPTESTG